jgi:large-conductance mechanosensitive channel
LLKSLKDNTQAVIDLGVVLMIGIAFAGLMVIAFIIWTINDTITPTAPTTASTAAYNTTYANTVASLSAITTGFDDAVGLLIVAITIFILAIAISALMMLRQR